MVHKQFIVEHLCECLKVAAKDGRTADTIAILRELERLDKEATPTEQFEARLKECEEILNFLKARANFRQINVNMPRATR